MKTTLALLLTLIMVLPALAEAPERIGIVSAVQGSASAKLGNAAARALAVRQPLYRNDVITTGANSRCVLLFADMTTFCLGANSSLRVEQYIAGHAAQFEMQRGTFRMMSGEIARTNPTQFNMSTPTASIGIRGTTTGHEVGEQGERHYVLDMEPGHQVIVSGLHTNNRLVIDADLTAVNVDLQGGIGPREQLTPEQAQNFTRQFDIDDPRAYLPPPLDANGNPILPPLLDANGNPLPPPPMYDAEGNLLPPAPMYDANGNPLPPPPMYDANGNLLPPPPMYDANGNPLPLPPMYDAAGNPLPPPPMYDANGNLLPPPPMYDAAGNPLPPPGGTYYAGSYLPPVQYDANGNPLPPPPDGAYYTGDYMPPVQYDAAGNPLPPPPMYDANGNLLPPPNGTTFTYDPNYMPPPNIFDPYAAYYTGDQIVAGGNNYTYFPTHMTGTMLLYNATGGGYSLTPGGIYKTGVISSIGPPTFTGPGGNTVTGGNAGGDAIVGVTASSPYTGWTGTEYVYRSLYGANYVPGTTNQYMGWGEWALVNPAAQFSDGVRSLAIASAFYVDGIKTPDPSLAALTSQNVIGYYNGTAHGVYMENAAVPQNISGSFSSTINFGTNQVTNTDINFAGNGIRLQQSATPVTLSPQGLFNISVMSVGGTTTMPLSGAGASGSITGACFGPNAEGVGGNWTATGANESATGVFAGTR